MGSNPDRRLLFCRCLKFWLAVSARETSSQECRDTDSPSIQDYFHSEQTLFVKRPRVLDLLCDSTQAATATWVREFTATFTRPDALGDDFLNVGIPVAAYVFP